MTPPTTPTISSGLLSFAIGGSVGGAATSSGLQMWGDNTQGQLGDGTNTSHWSPETIALQNVNKVVVGRTHVCALTNGSPATVYCWGENGYGQLSTSVAGITATSPVAVAWP